MDELRYRVRVFMPHNQTEEFYAKEFDWMYDYRAIKFDVNDKYVNEKTSTKIVFVGGGTVIVDQA